MEGQGEVEVESEEGEDVRDGEHGESEGEREHGEVEVEVGDQRGEESEGRDTDSDAKDDYSQRVVTSKRRDIVESGSEENHFNDEDVDAARSLRYHLVFH